MLRTVILRRLTASILLVLFLALAVPGVYLLHVFEHSLLAEKQESLLESARLASEVLPLEAGGGEGALLARLHSSTGVRMTLLSPGGRVLYDSDGEASGMENHSARPEVQEALAGGIGMATRYSGTLGQNMMYVAIPVLRDGEVKGVLRTSASLSLIEASYASVEHSIGAAFGLALVLGAVLAIYLARRQLAPLRTLIVAASEMASGSMTRRIYLSTGDEMELLARALNHLMDALSQEVEATQLAANKFAQIFSEMESPVLLLDEEGKITEANRAARKSFKLQEPLGRHSIHVMGEASLSEAARGLAIGGRSSLRVEQGGKTFDGVLSCFRVPMGRRVLAVFHDISALEALAQRERAFTGNAAHELATPLTSILGFAELLQEDGEDKAAVHHYASVILREGERMQGLIRALLTLARIEGGTAEEAAAPLGEAAEQTVAALRPRAEEKGVTLDLVAEPVSVRCPSELLCQCAKNLLENAIKYTPAGGRIEVAVKKEGNRGVLQVQDTGIGIPEEALPHVFERFYRVDKARARKTGGSGIGLSIVQAVATRYDAALSAWSKVGEGSTFSIAFHEVEA